MNNNLTQTFDFLFIGMGAANCLLLLKMNEYDLLRDKKIAIIEPNSSILNDRNFCFWSTKEDISNLNIEDLISSKWEQIKVTERKSQRIAPLFYYHIRGINLHNKVNEILKEQQVEYYKEIFNDIPLLESESFVINLINTKIEAKKVFDSRPPSYNPNQKNKSHLLQSFYGWEVSITDNTFDTSTMVMMDFDIAQNNYCQFMYVLPFSENTALFEVTRFGTDKISKEEANTLLTEYLNRVGFEYQIVAEEKGVIPMSSFQITHIDYGKNWVVTGANANMIKPTTGYAFHNMAIDASKQAEAMFNQQPFIRKNNYTRFKFYDNLLLKILEETPQQGKKIFQSLFNNISINDVLKFLSEKSSLNKELLIFSKLPILIFLRVALKDIFYRITNLAPTYLAFITTITFLFLYTLNLDKIIWLFLAVGFLSIGLSHGAVDHLTDKTIQGQKQVKFIIDYLIKGMLLGLLWIILPDLALLAFIAFSAWHFGQADFREWNLKQGFNTFVWGIIVLSIILFYHHNETITVLQHIKGLQIHQLLKDLSESQLFIGKIAITCFSILFMTYNKSKLMLITLGYLLLSSMLPLIVSFGIYFVTQHSMHGWKHLKKDLKINSYNLWLKSLPFSMGGALIILIFMLVNNKDYIGIFFIALSCISMPHIFLMHNFYERFNEKLK